MNPLAEISDLVLHPAAEESICRFTGGASRPHTIALAFSRLSAAHGKV